MTLSTWLKNHLIATGHLSPTGIGRRVQPRRCRCGANILIGSDDDIAALEVKVDPVPLSPLGEALALIEGRRTVALVTEAGRYVLWARDSWHITGRPAGSRPRHDVLREHRCNTATIAGPLTAPSSFPSTRTRQLPAGAPAPF